MIANLVKTAGRVAGLIAPRWTERTAARLFITPRRRRVSAETGPWTVTRVPRLSSHLAVWSAGRGPTVILVHGWEDDHGSMMHFAAPLIARGYRVVAYDQPAHGRSEGRRATIPDFARALAGMARDHGPVHGVIAHSLGGAAVALAIAEGLEVGRVAIVAAPAQAVAYIRETAKRLGLSDRRAAGMLAEISRLAGYPAEMIDAQVLTRDFSTPALFVHADNDRVVPLADGFANAEAWPGATLRLVSGLGHRRVLEDPGVVETVVDFIAPGCPEAERVDWAS